MYKNRAQSEIRESATNSTSKKKIVRYRENVLDYIALETKHKDLNPESLY